MSKRTVLPFASPRHKHSKIGFLTDKPDNVFNDQQLAAPLNKGSPYQAGTGPSRDSIHSIMNPPGKSGFDSSRKIMITAASPAPSQTEFKEGQLYPVSRRQSLLRLQPRPSILRGTTNATGDGIITGTHSHLPSLHTSKTPRHAPLFFVPPEASPAELKAKRAETKRQKVSRLAEMSELKFERRQERIHILWRKEKQERAEPEVFRKEIDSLVKSMESERNSFEQNILERESHIQRVKEFKKKTSLAGMHTVKLHRWQVMLPGKFFGARSADNSVVTNRPGPVSNRPH